MCARKCDKRICYGELSLRIANIPKTSMYILFLALVFASYGFSQNSNMDLEEIQMHKYGVVDSSGNLIPSNPESEKGFKVFWSVFRTAIITNDWDSIISNTHFPLETRGTMDGDPIVRIEKDRFQFVFKMFLESESSIPPFKTQFDKIKDKENVYPYITDDSYSYGDMQFKRINGKWFLVFIYIDAD